MIIALLTAALILMAGYAFYAGTMVAEYRATILMMSESAKERKAEIVRLNNLVEKEMNKTMLVLKQNQDFSQRLASLRVEHGAVPEETSYDPVPEVQPYSEGLQAFLSKLEHSESRRLVEEEIEHHRAMNKSDEQILAIIRSM